MNVEINGHKLRELRKLAGLDQVTLAERAGCTAPYISMMETGKARACSPGLFAKLCDALGVTERTTLMRKAAKRAAGAA